MQSVITKVGLGVGGVLLCICTIFLTLHLKHEHLDIVADGIASKAQSQKGNVNILPDSDHTFILTMKNGSPLPVRDFLKNADITADAENPGIYYVGNSISKNPHDTVPRYLISYEHTIQFFKIVLLQNPLGDARRDAETYLKRTLDITDAQLCDLNYVVTTPASVSQVYSSLDLKFSSCQDSVTLR